MKEKFIEFLKKNGAYDAYMRNTEENGGLKNFFEVVEPQKYICGSFVWEHTSEGHSYWSDLDYEWLNELGL